MKILVTGAQRSSTRFYAKYLAKKQNSYYIDEEDYNFRDYDKLKEILKDKEDAVIHGPAIKHLVEQFKKDYPNSKIIWMYRDPEETKKSMERINWQGAHTELDNMKPLINKYEIPFVYVPKNESEKVIAYSKALGIFCHCIGIVDELTDMEELKDLEGFKKTSFKNEK